MKQGRFVRIPQHPSDVETLWQQAAPLDPQALPGWLTPDVASMYRRVCSLSLSGLSADDRRACSAELSDLEALDFVVDTGANDAEPEIYMPVPDTRFSIGIYHGDDPFHLTPAASPPELSRSDVTDAVASFVADPFMIRIGDAWWMFFEVMNWTARKGEIACAESRDGLSWSYRGIVLRESFHLSYPYVFEWRGSVFMIPETYQARSIRLYRAKRFPDEWTLAGTLLENGYFVDGSSVWHEDRWWLFAETDPQGHRDTLRLYSAPHLDGPWTEHPQSPIVRGDSSKARPAGRVIRVGGKLVRFGQDCSTGYGLGVRAFEILTLDPQVYSEREVEGSPILAGSGHGWNAGGMHHVDAHQLADGRWIAAVDGWRNGS